MRPYFQYILLIFLIGISVSLQAQVKRTITKKYKLDFSKKDTSEVNIKNKVKEKKLNPDDPAINIFLEIGGASLVGAMYVDSRFSKKRDGFGMSVGAGYSKYKGEEHYSVPIQLNYLKSLKKPTLFFEVGGGLTFHNYGIFKNLFSLGRAISSTQQIIQEDPQTYGVIVIAMRKIPLKEDGFFFRVANNIMIGKDGIAPLYPSVSLGVRFGVRKKK